MELNRDHQSVSHVVKLRVLYPVCVYVCSLVMLSMFLVVGIVRKVKKDLHGVSFYISEQNLNFNLEQNPKIFNRPFDYKEKECLL